MKRRDFLRSAALAAGSSLFLPRRAGASLWAEPPSDKAAAMLLPSGTRAEKVLDLFLYGGLGPFESFYVVPEYGRPEDPTYPNQQWYLFQSQHAQVFGNRCGLGEEAQWLMPWKADAAGVMVNLGPLVMPLRNRPDLLSRMRVLVMRHDLEPHEAAIPLALSGQRLGSPRLAGLGASVQRYFVERDTTGRLVPWSYVLYPNTEISTDNLRAASSVGLHPGSARPLDLRIEADSTLPELLSRSVLGDRKTQYDALVAWYAEKAQGRYTRTDGTALRSKSLSDYGYMLKALANADSLLDIFTAEVLANQGNESCGQDNDTDTTLMGLSLAAHLLTHPDSPARHVTVVDGGLIPASGGGAFDVHDSHLPDTARNLIATLTSLCSIINEPGEKDPGKLNLDDTLVVLNTEFGRTPYTQEGTFNGTNHHPYGYVTVLLGGPIQEDQAGIFGAIGPSSFADSYITPVEGRAAVLAAMGIYPFTNESFAIGDVGGFTYELDGLAWLNQQVLGRK